MASWLGSNSELRWVVEVPKVTCLEQLLGVAGLDMERLGQVRLPSLLGERAGLLEVLVEAAEVAGQSLTHTAEVV